MKTKTEYDIVYQATIPILKEKVQTLIDAGWECQGGPFSTASFTFGQAMVRTVSLTTEPLRKAHISLVEGGLGA